MATLGRALHCERSTFLLSFGKENSQATKQTSHSRAGQGTICLNLVRVSGVPLDFFETRDSSTFTEIFEFQIDLARVLPKPRGRYIVLVN